MATDNSAVIAGTGNVFADLNMPDADDRLLKAQLAALIGETIAQLGLTQAAAAKLLGIAQPDVSSLLRGRLRGYSLERLIDFARTLGNDVEIKVRRAKRETRGHLTVLVA